MILTEEQKMIRDMARDFAQGELLPHAAEWSREHAFPREALAKMGELGLLGMIVPEEWGGAGADNVSYALAIEEIAAGDGATSTSDCPCRVDTSTTHASFHYLPNFPRHQYSYSLIASS